MNHLPLDLYDVNQIRQLEKLVLQKQAISIHELMCRAGEAVFDALMYYWPETTSISVLIGTGNNGGDGLVLARLAKQQGIVVHVFQVGEIQPEKLSAAAFQARKDWQEAGGMIEVFSEKDFPKVVQGVIVDALLGIGSQGDLSPFFETAVNSINASGLPVLSIDIPSGLDADTGFTKNAVHATVTIVLFALKIGLMTGVAANYRGELMVDDLGLIPEAFRRISPIGKRIVYEHIITQLPERSLSTHKGEQGHVCVVGGGSAGLSGAVLLAGEAALRAGAGLVTIAASPDALPLLSRGPMELMCHIIDDTDVDLALAPLLERANVMLLGPGLGQSDWSETLFKKVIFTQKPCVIDADGLNWLAKNPQKRTNWILTPHPKEAARLLNTSVEIVQMDRIAAVKALAAQYGGVIVLKGAGTLVMGSEEGLMHVEEQGLPVLSTAGTGDVLAGLIGGLLAQGLPLLLAAQLGVSVHATAAQIEMSLGERGMLASDLFLHIRALLSRTAF